MVRKEARPDTGSMMHDFPAMMIDIFESWFLVFEV